MLLTMVYKTLYNLPPMNSLFYITLSHANHTPATPISLFLALLQIGMSQPQYLCTDNFSTKNFLSQTSEKLAVSIPLGFYSHVLYNIALQPSHLGNL